MTLSFSLVIVPKVTLGFVLVFVFCVFFFISLILLGMHAHTTVLVSRSEDNFGESLLSFLYGIQGLNLVVACLASHFYPPNHHTEPLLCVQDSVTVYWLQYVDSSGW